MLLPPFSSDNIEPIKKIIEAESGKSIHLILTDNSSTVLSVKRSDGLTILRLHRMFVNADRAVLSEIGQFISKRRIKTPLLRCFVRENSHLLPKKPPKTIYLRPIGEYYNLKEIYASVNEEYFGGGIMAHITWGKGVTGKRVKRRILGTYTHKSKIIRINPILDNKNVPIYFVRFIVYHEMLHADIPTEIKNGRRCVHSRIFRGREREFKEYEEAVWWEKNKLK